MEIRPRFSDPYLNRFLQPDTLIPNLYAPQSLNRYSFVGNNPINRTDPSGHNYDCGPLECPQDMRKDYGDSTVIKKPRGGKSGRNGGSNSSGNGGDFPNPCDNNYISLNCLNPQPSAPSNSQAGLYVTKYEWHFDKVDWMDIGLNFSGIVGDIGFDSTVVGDPLGPEIWLATEGLEIIAIGRDTYKSTPDDFSSPAQDVTSKIIKAILKEKKAPDLIPVVGFLFNARNIFTDIQGGYVSTPDYFHKNEGPLIKPFP